MRITEPLRLKLAEAGVATLFRQPFLLPDASVLEPPCSLKRMAAVHSLRMGAFSYAASGFFFAARIGRYCSIGEAVQVGRGSHPIGWGSTSPLFYQPHMDVFNQPVREAASFRYQAHVPAVEATIIGHDVRIGHGALLSQGVKIGNGAVVEPFAVVTKDVPPFAIVAGNPAVVTGMRLPLRLAARAEALAWWRYAFWDLSGAPVNRPQAFLDHVARRVAEGISVHEPAPIKLTEFAAAGAAE